MESKENDKSTKMLDDEYYRMASAESELWWYRSLHEFVLDKIQQCHGSRTSIRILDAGCGTGGLLTFLRNNGYSNTVGIDISKIAIEFCRNNGFKVIEGSIADQQVLVNLGKFDVIVSLDVICSLPNEGERKNFFRGSHQALNQGGFLFVQTPAFKLLSGIHDLAVGVNHRYTRHEMTDLLTQAGIKSPKVNYRLFIFTPIIFIVRMVQQLMLWLKGPNVVIKSDVSMPASFVNSVLLFIQRFEDRVLPVKPFGTSLQIQITKR